MKKIILFLFTNVLIFMLFGCNSNRRIDSETFEFQGFNQEGAVKAQDNIYYYFVENYDEYNKLITDEKIALTNYDKFDQEFFKENILIFLEVKYSTGIDDLEITTSFKKNDLVIHLEPSFNNGQYLDSRKIAIELKRVSFNKIIIK